MVLQRMSRFTIQGTLKAVPEKNQDAKVDAKASVSKFAPIIEKPKLDPSRPQLSEEEAVETLVDMARHAADWMDKEGSNDLDESIYLASDEDLIRSIEDGEGSTSLLGNVSIVATRGNPIETDGLMILASCLLSVPARDISESERMNFALSFLDSVGSDRKKLASWTTKKDKITKEVTFVTPAGIKVRSMLALAETLGLPQQAVKLAELFDYLDERGIVVVPADWKCEERRRPDGKRSGFSYVHGDTNKTFYARAKVADYIESRKIMLSKKKTLKNTDAAGKNKEEESPKGLGKNKKRKTWKVGATVQVDYEGTVFDAIIVPSPRNYPTVDDEEGERLYSVYYSAEGSCEHGVLQTRILKARPSNDDDEVIIDQIESGTFEVDKYTSQNDRQKKHKNKKRAKNESDGPEKKKKQRDDELDMSAVNPEEEAIKYFNAVQTRIGATSPRLFMNFVTAIAQVLEGQISINDVSDFIVEAFGEDDTDLVLGFNIFLPDELKITPQYIRKRLAYAAALARERKPAKQDLDYDNFVQLVSARLNVCDPTGVQRFKEMMAQFQIDDDIPKLLNGLAHLFAGHSDILQALDSFVPAEFRPVAMLV